MTITTQYISLLTEVLQALDSKQVETFVSFLEEGTVTAMMRDQSVNKRCDDRTLTK